MGIRGKGIGRFENPRKTDARTWIKIRFVEVVERPGWWFLYDMESKKEPWRIGWLHKRSINKLTYFPGMLNDLRNGDIKEIRLLLLRSGVNYHPFFSPDPQGFNKKDDRQDVYSGTSLPDE